MKTRWTQLEWNRSFIERLAQNGKKTQIWKHAKLWRTFLFGFLISIAWRLIHTRQKNSLGKATTTNGELQAARAECRVRSEETFWLCVANFSGGCGSMFSTRLHEWRNRSEQFKSWSCKKKNHVIILYISIAGVTTNQPRYSASRLQIASVYSVFDFPFAHSFSISFSDCCPCNRLSAANLIYIYLCRRRWKWTAQVRQIKSRATK